MRRFIPAVVAIVVIGVVLVVPMVFAAAQSITLQPSDTLVASCSTHLTGTISDTQASLACEALPTAVPTATAMPDHTHGICGESNDVWHPPVVNGCATGHEHGDAPPAWVTAAGYTPMFTHPANTPNENLLVHKHSAFKGFSGRMNGIDVYVVMHLDTNPGGGASRFHSYQYWMRDPSGGVSHLSGWLDFGPRNTTQTGPNLERKFCDGDTIRPIISVNSLDPGCTGPLQFESWYSQPAGHLGNAGWMPDFGFNVSPNFYEGGDPADPTTWTPTGGNNLNRRIEVAWYANRDGRRGDFYATQFGRVVAGPTDPACGQPYTVGTRTYTVVCLLEHLATSATTLGFPGNAFQRSYPGEGVVNPN